MKNILADSRSRPGLLSPVLLLLLSLAFGSGAAMAQFPATPPPIAATPIAASENPTASTTPRLRVTLPWGAVITYPTVTHGKVLYLSTADTDALLRAVDRLAEINFDSTTGVYHAKLLAREFTLFQNQSILVFNNSIIETRHRLLPARGQVYVPLSSLKLIFVSLGDFQSNIAEILASAPSATAPSPSSSSTPFPPIESEFKVDAHTVTEILKSLTTRDNTASPLLQEDLRRAAKPLYTRRAIIIDPQPDGGALSGSVLKRPSEGEGGESSALPIPDPPDLTLKIALGCRRILAAHPTLQIILTRENNNISPTPDQRLRLANTSNARAIISLRLDWSPNPDNQGYRLFTMHQAIDPLGFELRGKTRDKNFALPEEAVYLPYENVSLVLARLLEEQISRSGLVPAPDKIQLAPFYLLKRSNMPSVSLSMGYWSNDSDRARMSEDDYVDSMAAGLAQALIHYSWWLEQIQKEEP